jgi:isocitrate dehydrogenase kinase/phosphatase
MNFQFYLEKLKESEEFKEFTKKFPKAYLTSAFFSIDKTGKEDNSESIDYYVPETKEFISFKLSNPIQKIPMQVLEGQEFSEVSQEVNFDLNEVETLVQEKMKEQEIKNSVQKLMYSLQQKENKNYIIGTLFLSNLALVKFVLNLETKTIEEFNKNSLMDLFKFKKKE